jgi:predicted Zn-dependent peptidase
VGFKDAWLRPDRLKIFVVSDRPLAEIQPLIEAEFGSWATPATPAGVKQFSAPPPRPSAPRIVLVNRPDSPQSVISGGQITPADPRNNIEALIAANDVLGGNFLSRINMDLREAKGWSYGVAAGPADEKAVLCHLRAGPSRPYRFDHGLEQGHRRVLKAKGITAEELPDDRQPRQCLPGQYETSGAVLSAMMSNDLMGVDQYQEHASYRSYTAAADLIQAIRGAVQRFRLGGGWRCAR